MLGHVRDETGAFGRFPNTTNLTTALSAGTYFGGPPLNITTIQTSGLFPLGNSSNATLNTFYASTRVGTDLSFRCGNQAMAVTAKRHNAFPKVYTYQNDRTYQIAWNPNAPARSFPRIIGSSLTSRLGVRPSGNALPSQWGPIP